MTAPASTPPRAQAIGASTCWTSPPVTTTQLVQYAGASGDFNPLHFDHHFALAAGQPGVIAHGMLTMGFMAIALESTLAPHDRVCSLSSRFSKPVRPGDRVHVEVRILQQDQGPNVCTLHCQLEAWVNEVPVAHGDAVVERRLPPP